MTVTRTERSFIVFDFYSSQFSIIMCNVVEYSRLTALVKLALREKNEATNNPKIHSNFRTKHKVCHICWRYNPSSCTGTGGPSLTSRKQKR